MHSSISYHGRLNTGLFPGCTLSKAMSCSSLSPVDPRRTNCVFWRNSNCVLHSIGGWARIRLKLWNNGLWTWALWDFWWYASSHTAPFGNIVPELRLRPWDSPACLKLGCTKENYLPKFFGNGLEHCSISHCRNFCRGSTLSWEGQNWSHYSMLENQIGLKIALSHINMSYKLQLIPD